MEEVPKFSKITARLEEGIYVYYVSSILKRGI